MDYSMPLFREAIVLFEKATEKPLPPVISMQTRYGPLLSKETLALCTDRNRNVPIPKQVFQFRFRHIGYLSKLGI